MARTKSNTPGTGFTEPLYHSGGTQAKGYVYRNQLGMVPSAEYLHFFDDFVGPVTSNVPHGWQADIIDVGCTVTQADLAGGAIVLTSDAINEGAAVYGHKSIQLVQSSVGKKFFMEARVKVLDVSDNTFQMGLTDLVAVTNPEDLWTTTSADYIALGTLDTASVALTTAKNGSDVTGTVSTAATLADDTWVTLAIAYNGANTAAAGGLTSYVNGKLHAYAAAADIPDDVVLAPFFGMLGGAASDTAHVDYVRLVVER